MAQVAGTIKAVTGLVGIMKPGGPMYGAKVGDVVEENDVVKTLDPNSSIVLELEGGREIVLGGDEEVLVDKSVFAAVDEGTTVDMAALQAALQAEGKPGEMEATASGKEGATPDDMEATAAGEEGPGDPALVDVPYTERGDARGDVEVSLRPTEFGGAGVEPGAENVYDYNDIATVSDDEGSVTEDESPQILQTNGQVIVSDADVGESQAQPQNNTPGEYGTFSVNANGDWTYQADNTQDAIQQLAVGQTLTETFTVTSLDGTGTGTVTITIIGTNDIPLIGEADLIGGVTEIGDNLPGENVSMLSDSGNISFGDIDLIDTHTVSVTPQAGGYLGTLGAVVSDDSTGDNAGTLTWTFTVSDADVDYLAAGQELKQYYDVSVDDGHGGVATETVEITITGTNDVPVIGTADLVGGVTEIGDNQPGENATLLSDSGNISFGDVDLIDTHTVSVTPQAGGYLGTLGAVVTDPSTGDGSGTVQWTFSVQDADVDYLAAGQTLTQYYDVSVDDGHGGVATETVAITITGTNDAPIIGESALYGGVTEIADNAPGENSDNLTDTGDISFNDVDLLDTHTVSVTPQAGGYLGSLTAYVSDAATGDGSGTVTWDFSVNDADVDYLAAGQSLTQYYDVSVNDGHGGVATETVTITITGTNDAPIIGEADLMGGVTEIADNAPGENATLLSDTGNISFGDVDLIDTHTVSVTPQAGGYLGTLGAVVSDPSTGDGAGTLTWTFSVPDADVDYLAEGQTLTQYYDVSVNDGHGGIATETVAITITGTNDAPVIGESALYGGVTEIGDNQPGENATLLSDTGNISFGDVDLIDTHTVSVTPQAAGYLGTLGAVVTDPSTGDGSGTVGWTFTVADADVDYLAAGQTLKQYYDVSVNDGHGGVATETVEITITGTNDAPVIGTADLVGSVTEIADNAPGENATMLSDSGNISFSDVDLIDTHTVSVTPQAGGYLGTLGAVVSNPSTGDGSGTLTWTFMVADADVDYLAAGQTLTQYYDVSVNDGHGGVATETVEITITGTNDAPIIGTADLVGGVTEIGDGQPGENATLLSDSGNISFGDVDLIDTHTVSVTPQAGGYLGTLGAVVTDPSTGDGSGTVQWTFSVQDSAVDYLAAGETLTQYYDVSVNDGHGGIATETVTITITGTNDAPTAVGDVGTMDAVTYTFSWDYSLNAGNDYSNDNVTITAINGNSVDGSGPTMGVDGYPQNDSGQMLDPGEGIQFVFDDPVKLVRVDFGNFNVHDTATWEVWNGNTFVASGVYTNSGNPNDSIFDYEFGTEFDTIKITNTDASNSFSIDEVLVSNQGSQSFVEGTPLYFAEADLLYNDFDPDTADTLNITGLDSDGDMQSTSAFGATVTLDAEGNVLYDPSSIDWENPTWNPGDSDTFNYTVSDGNGGFDTGTVTVNVNYVDSGTAFDGNTLLVDDYLLSGEQSINFDNLALLADNVTHIDLKDGDEGKALATLTADNVSDLLGDTYTTLHIDGESVDSVNLSNDFTFDQALSDGATGYDAYTGTASGGEEVIVYIDTDITDVNIIP